jgi:hypothetical protein
MEQFHWTSPGGVEIVLPRLSKIKSGLLRKHRHKDPDDHMFSIIEEVADEDMLAKIDNLETGEFNDMSEAWGATISAGESSSSST